MRNRGLFGILPAARKRVLMVIMVVMLSMTFAVGSHSMVSACEGSGGPCTCPGC